MKKNYSGSNKKFFYLQAGLLLWGAFQLKAQVTQTFNYTGAMQTFTVPACVSSVTVDLRGAEGGSNISSPVDPGGLGGRLRAVYPVSAGQVLNIFVGGRPYNGGGTAINNGGLGGGASDIRIGGVALTDRVLVAGGGGGGSNNCSYVENGGAGGGLTGETGWQCGAQTQYVGTGGSQTAGGLCLSTLNPGTNGALGVGGTGGVGGSSGAGGGGGYYGGGGASYGGGGGGSSYTGPGATSVVHTQGFQSGMGLVVISYDFNGQGLNTSASTYSICTGGTATLAASNVLSYTWTPGGSNSSSITVSPAANTNYTVEGTNSLGCISKSVVTVAVDQNLPVLSFTNTANSAGICPNTTVSLSAGGASSYTWTGGPTTVTNGVAFSATTSANYTVTGANGCGTGSAVTSVSVHPFPTMNTTVSSPTLCSGNSLTLTATGTGTSYVWSGAATTITNGVGFVPTTSSTFVVIGTSALSCTALASVPVTVYITPTLAPVASPSMVCIGGSSTLSAVGALNYTWTSATQTVNTNTLLVTPNLGLSSYTVTKSNSNCSHTSVISITTNSLPTIAAFANPATACALSPVTLAAGGAQTYTWTAPGTPNYTFTGSSNVISAPVSTTYSVAASDGTCVNVATVLLNIDPNPTISISVNSSSICNGQQVTLTASGGNSYTWTAGSTTLTGPSITQSPTGPVSYVVTGDNNFGCTSQASQVILVYNSPTITVSANKSLICSGDPVTFNAAGASTYTWDASAGGLTSSSVTVNPTNSSSGFVTYTVQGTNPQGCVGSKAAQVNIYVPVLSVSGTTNACKGDAISLTANGGNGGSYNWNTGSGSPVSSQVISVPVTAPAVYTLSANSTSLNISCPASRTVAVGLYPDANIIATAERSTICNNESVELYASGGVSYSWNTTATGGTIVVKPLIQTTYTVTGIDNNGCKGTGTVQVKMSGCVGIAEQQATTNNLRIYPNPNNGEFTIQSSSAITLLLVNELGQLVQKIELSEGNNYKASVKDLSNGIYFLSGKNGSDEFNQKIIVTR